MKDELFSPAGAFAPPSFLLRKQRQELPVKEPVGSRDRADWNAADRTGTRSLERAPLRGGGVVG